MKLRWKSLIVGGRKLYLAFRGRKAVGAVFQHPPGWFYKTDVALNHGPFATAALAKIALREHLAQSH